MPRAAERPTDRAWVTRIGDAELRAKAERTTLPTNPCFRCEARGWCDHRSPE